MGWEASRADLQRAATIARVLGCIGRALAWERSLSGLEDDEMDGDGVAGWLVELTACWATCPLLDDQPLWQVLEFRILRVELLERVGND